MEAGTRQTEEYLYGLVERAIGWETGSVARVLAGGEPTPLPAAPEAPPGVKPFDLRHELERIRHLDLPAYAKLELIRAVMDLYDEAQAELRQQQHTN